MAKTEAFFSLARFFPLPSDLLQGTALEHHFQQCVQLTGEVDIWKVENPKNFEALKNLVTWVERKLERTQAKDDVCSLVNP
jgi:oligoribonuclease NrnB/cAMP/cGMP phosphodiesterase (DHH superfamily)